MKNIIFLLLLLSITVSNAQNCWEEITTTSQQNNVQHYTKTHLTKKENLFALSINSFTSQLKLKSKLDSSFIELPNSQGGVSKFKVKETSIIKGQLAKKFPNIKSYKAIGIDDVTANANISIGKDGVHVMITSTKDKTIYIDPFTKNKEVYTLYKKEDVTTQNNKFTCYTNDLKKTNTSIYKTRQLNIENNIYNEGLKIFRLALVCSGEYAQFHLNRQGVSDDDLEQTKKEVVLSAMNTSITRINSVFERDLNVQLVFVENNDQLIFLNPATDNITDGSATKMINEVQNICDTEIGNANYDIGHLFSIGGDGIATLESVCVSGIKGRGVTGRSEPIGDLYDIDYVAHEMGHQFGATHTQNNSCKRTAETAIEPGSGSTIMGYAGICDPNIQNQSDDYFHTVSIAQIQHTLKNGATCAAVINTNNTSPIVNAGFDVYIPKSTPFKLTGVATDTEDTDLLTYNWEQLDNGIATIPQQATNKIGPLFRSLPSSTSSNRYFPLLETVVSGDLYSEWEVLPSVAREMNFALTVRDNHFNGGLVTSDEVKVTVTESDPFLVTSPSENVEWDVGSIQTITWNKSTTDQPPINCHYVSIKLSIDGGKTFPIILLENTPNDGMQDIIIPNVPTTNARIMVEAVENVFYQVNTSNFTINERNTTFVVSNTSGEQFICNDINSTINYTIALQFKDGFKENVSFSTSNLPTGAKATFSKLSLNKDDFVEVIISNLNTVKAGNYEFVVTGTSPSVTQNATIHLNVYDLSFSKITLTQPTNKSVDVNLAPTFFWERVSNTASYDIQIALDVNFNKILIAENILSNTYTASSLLALNTTYYWRVKPKNNCSEGVYSNTASFTTTTPSYCSSTFTDERLGTEHITNVTFNTINHTTGNDMEDGYQDFSSVSTVITPGKTYTLSVTYDTGGYQDHCYVFIDWNQDYEFDNEVERYDLGSRTEDLATTTLDIKVPEKAALGNIKMRVIIEYDDAGSYGDGACDIDHKSEWGETEDYRLEVQSSTLSVPVLDTSFKDISLFPNPSKGMVHLSFETKEEGYITIHLIDITGKIIEKKDYTLSSFYFSQELFFNHVPPGLYFIQIQNGKNQITKKIILR